MAMKTHLQLWLFLFVSLPIFSCKDDSAAPIITIPPTLSQEARVLSAGLKIIGGTSQSQVYQLPAEKSDPNGLLTETTIAAFEQAVKQSGSFTANTVLGVTTYRTSILNSLLNGIQWTIGLNGTKFKAVGRIVEKNSVREEGSLQLTYLSK